MERERRAGDVREMEREACKRRAREHERACARMAWLLAWLNNVRETCERWRERSARDVRESMREHVLTWLNSWSERARKLAMCKCGWVLGLVECDRKS